MNVHTLVRGKEVDKPLEEIALDELILIKPNEPIPVDGIITEGMSSVNEEALRGEKRPVDKTVGSTVYTGSTNNEGRIIVRVSALGENTYQAKLNAAATEKHHAPDEHQACQRAVVWLSIIIFSAILVGAIWYFAKSPLWLLAAASVLLIGSPTLFRAKTQGVYSAKRAELRALGALVRHPSTLDKLSQVTTIVFDRTGVLTSAAINVEHVVSFRPYTQQQVLNLAATLERNSSHHVATTIVSFANKFGGFR